MRGHLGVGDTEGYARLKAQTPSHNLQPPHRNLKLALSSTMFATFLLRNQLQVVSRGMLGRRRAAARRSMIAAATRALDWVSLERLQPRHLKELARAIHGALVDPVVSVEPHACLCARRKQ